MDARHDEAALVVAAQTGDGDAFSTLYERWFDRSYDVVLRIVHNREVAAEVTQDVFLVAWRQLDSLRDPASFGGWVLRSARNRALNRLDRERRSVALGDEETVMEIDRHTDATDPVAAAFDQSALDDLVWAASAALGERDASILSLHLRHGLDGADLAAELGVSANSANQAMFRLRQRLGGAVRAWMLWRGGEPACEVLGAALTVAGIESFGRDAMRVINGHAEDCETCGEESRRLVAPEALFAAVPILTAPPTLRAELTAALRDQGVPLREGSGDGGPPDGSADVDPTAGVATVDATPVPDGDQEVVSAPAGDPADKPPVLMLVLTAMVLIIAGLAFFTGTLDDSSPVELTAAGDTTTSSSATSEAPQAAPADPALPVVPPVPDPETTSSTAGVTTTVSPQPPVTTTSSTSSSTTSTPVGPAPVVQSFIAERILGPGCPSLSERILMTWSTENATSVTITGPGYSSGPLPPSGNTVVCHGGPADYYITASGPGGSAMVGPESVGP